MASLKRYAHFWSFSQVSIAACETDRRYRVIQS
jgi:hypothetical protein